MQVEDILLQKAKKKKERKMTGWGVRGRCREEGSDDEHGEGGRRVKWGQGGILGVAKNRTGAKQENKRVEIYRMEIRAEEKKKKKKRENERSWKERARIPGYF